MKLAVSGKGGVGKSTIAAALALRLAKQNHTVLAVDADPDSNLAAALGFSAEEQKAIIPISRQIKLIEERTGAKIKQYGQMFKLNPQVSDIVEKYAYRRNEINLVVLGAVDRGGSGCACPESVFIRALVSDMVLFKKETLIMDMEAGIEHLGRATVRGVNFLIIVVEPGQRSVDTAKRVTHMAAEIGLTSIGLVANKVNSQEEEAFLKEQFRGDHFLGTIPYREEIRRNDRDGRSVLEGLNNKLLAAFDAICQNLVPQ